MPGPSTAENRCLSSGLEGRSRHLLDGGSSRAAQRFPPPGLRSRAGKEAGGARRVQPREGRDRCPTARLRARRARGRAGSREGAATRPSRATHPPRSPLASAWTTRPAPDGPARASDRRGGAAPGLGGGLRPPPPACTALRRLRVDGAILTRLACLAPCGGRCRDRCRGIRVRDGAHPPDQHTRRPRRHAGARAGEGIRRGLVRRHANRRCAC
jgi:hypothetical protein